MCLYFNKSDLYIFEFDFYIIFFQLYGVMRGPGGAHEEDPFEIQEQEQNDDNQLMVTFS